MIFLSKRKNRFLISLLSGIMMVIAFPYTGSLTFLFFISLVPLLLVENYVFNNLKSRKLFGYSYLSFFIYNIGTTWWIWNASAGGMLFAVFLNSLLMAVFFQFYHILKKNISRKYGLIFFIASWLSFEYFHYSWELSWPWLNFGNIFSITPNIIQWYEYTGVLGGSLWLLLINYIFYYIIVLYQKDKELSQTWVGVLFITIISPMILSQIVNSNYNEKLDPIEVLCLQPNIDPYNEKFNTSITEQINKLLSLARKNLTNKTSLIIAPETAISSPVWENNFEQTPICSTFLDFSSEYNVPFLTGASTLKFFTSKNSNVSRELINSKGFYESYNTSILFEKDSFPRFIHKSKLVLGVEKIPFNTILPQLEDLAINLDGASGSLGVETEAKSFNANEIGFTSTVCYESVYGEFVSEQVKDGAELIFIITNDGWWGNTPGYKQHASFASLRAIENRRSIARSANTGISCLINQRGEVLSKTEWWVEDVVRGSINKNQVLSFYTKNGDWIGRFSEVIWYVSILILLFIKIKKAIKK